MDVYRAWAVLREVEAPPLEPLPITEESRLRMTRELYGRDALVKLQAAFSWVDAEYDKIAVEQTILSSETKNTILRLPMIYGPRDPLHRWFPLTKRMADQRPAIILAEDFAVWRGPRGYVDDMAHAICLAVQSPQSGRIYNVCEEPCLSELEWQDEIRSEANWTGHFVLLPRERVPKHLLVGGNFHQFMVVSSERIRRELGYREQIPRPEAIRRTLRSQPNHPPPAIDARQFDYPAEDAALGIA
jgi:nucleoside-diphosphate-sugar epimerase